MTSEDMVAAKLKGFNCFIKFLDGEELLLTIEEFDNDDARAEWLYDVEKYINNDKDQEGYFPASNISIKRDTVKYVKIL